MYSQQEGKLGTYAVLGRTNVDKLCWTGRHSQLNV